MIKNVQKTRGSHPAGEKMILLGAAVILMTIAAWLSQEIIPGYVIVFAVMLAAAIAMYRMFRYIEAKEREICEKERMLAEIQMEKMRGNLLRSISHDLRTPLANINGSSELILGERISEEKKKELLINIQDDSRWLINMIENLLIVSRIDGDHLCVVTSDELVEEIVAEAVQKVEKRYPQTCIDVKAPADLLMVPMDACLIEQVLINLVENAILHSGHSGEVEVIVRDTPHAVIFTVRDYGVGISEEKLPHLFDGCIYSDSDKPDAYRGLGIGLTICKTIITAHHGIIIGRNHARGAEFVFTLPKE